MLQLQKLVVGGELPCTKEEAATLASIQLHIEEAWPENDTQANIKEIHQKLQFRYKWEASFELFLV